LRKRQRNFAVLASIHWSTICLICMRETKFSFDSGEGRRKILMALRKAFSFLVALGELTRVISSNN
jgi:hypothetical protein